MVDSLLRDRLRQQKEFILNDWFQRILDGHSKESAVFFLEKPDRFANPVAHAFGEAMEAIYRALADGCDVDRDVLEYAMKIKAVQGHDPSEGVAFIYLLKDLLREIPSGLVSEDEWTGLESRIDRIASVASEMFIANRRKIAEIAGKLQGSKTQSL
jgi:hypothetical protein